MAGSGANKEGPSLICRNVRVGKRRTSLRMEPYIWDSLREICEREDLTINEICTQIDQRRGQANLTASIRVFIVSYFRNAMELLASPGESGPAVFRKALDDAIPLEE
ncbi:ribbon-helix-helix domain-containing protein [Azospirillum sp. SYSU D00513]|uniref:ribbon-helix-helix domain-containing protein n=1 Tax=Azospirillum sp. SYSU D00513 TaxID=2812561 RepID=UPI001A962B1F|nr:ribbon-helix-helix domain-containing protein [Azospirillum sp. SYSU D00513]